jgi:hypothetical protein
VKRKKKRPFRAAFFLRGGGRRKSLCGVGRRRRQEGFRPPSICATGIMAPEQGSVPHGFVEEGMPRDDWKYDEDMWEEGREEEGKEPPKEKQCPRCLHWVPREESFCSWCGRPLGNKP